MCYPFISTLLFVLYRFRRKSRLHTLHVVVDGGFCADEDSITSYRQQHTHIFFYKLSGLGNCKIGLRLKNKNPVHSCVQRRTSWASWFYHLFLDFVNSKLSSLVSAFWFLVAQGNLQPLHLWAQITKKFDRRADTRDEKETLITVVTQTKNSCLNNFDH